MDSKTAQDEVEPDFDDVDYISVELVVVDTSGGHFRTDDPRPPRSTIVRETGILIRYGIIDTIHGKVSGPNSIPCSIIVVDFQFDLINISRCIHQVNIYAVIIGPGIEIDNVSPADRVSINRSTQDVEKMLGAGLNVGDGAFVGGNANAQSTKKKEEAAYATVRGWPTHHPRSRERNGLPQNCARWAVQENPIAQDGVPARLRAAILVARSDDQRFQLDITFNIKADWLSRLEEMFGENPAHVPIIIDPRMSSTKRAITDYENDHLGQVDFKKIFKFSYGAFVENRFSSE